MQYVQVLWRVELEVIDSTVVLRAVALRNVKTQNR